jgi:hypothetical protein
MTHGQTSAERSTPEHRDRRGTRRRRTMGFAVARNIAGSACRVRAWNRSRSGATPGLPARRAPLCERAGDQLHLYRASGWHDAGERQEAEAKTGEYQRAVDAVANIEAELAPVAELTDCLTSLDRGPRR